MSTQTIVSWLTQIFSDPQAAQNYANDPTQATQRELGDVDLSAVDMRQAVTDACQSAGINPDATEAIVNSMYQPAQTLRVPSERLTLNDDGYPERCDYTDLVNNYDDQSTVSEPCLVGRSRSHRLEWSTATMAASAYSLKNWLLRPTTRGTTSPRGP